MRNHEVQMIELSKKTKKQLKDLIQRAYTMELEQLLLKLSKQFNAWKEGQIDCWQLEEKIDHFHSKESRKLFEAYNCTTVSPVVLVGSAIIRNLIKMEEVPEEALIHVERAIAVLTFNG
jgi:hypothetical protein